MRLLSVVLTLCISLSCFAFPRIDVVLDLDELLFFLMPDLLEEDSTHVNTVLPEPTGEVSYRVADGAAAFIRSLEFLPGDVRVSFHSTGLASRNLSILAKLMVDSLRQLNALELAERVLSRQHVGLTALRYHAEAHEGGLDPAIFPEAEKGNAKKDLSMIEGLDLSYAILLDDYNRSALSHQRFNLFWLPEPFGAEFWEKWSTTKKLVYLESADHIILSHLRAGDKAGAMDVARKYFYFRNRLAFARGLLQQIFEKAKQSGATVPSVIEEMLWTKRGDQYYLNRGLWDDYSIYRLGRSLIRRADPQFQLYKIEVEGLSYPACSQEMTDPV
ncbi:MAG: hypothetical protein KDD39_10170 [Bdellovibrionales bacterium]|nr:hypothetical protein [Bdellovibrionales bacterium]